ncbi:NUDIX domain-containing protein [Sphingomonas sp. RP10(2022)]|uniref:NUDIX domain-containing protein n=1 Tax=Sphingomonas liriopis TaxID=2949094 RepID=A0A9X2HY28_9SPHN|nr:NUDIX domain-containing protein [Sphingomonas liriopis]MCP3735469.1 NUDIX domain-containing protein [Sphingomonas liriopis]
MRPLIDLAYRLRRRAMALVGWRTRGVKVMAFDGDGAVLLVRHRYGRSDLWMLPGGGIARREAPAAAAVREIGEETGCVLRDAAAIGTFVAWAEGRRDTVHLFRGTIADVPRVDGVELAEARFFALDALPEALSPATRRRIDEVQGRRVADGRW